MEDEFVQSRIKKTHRTSKKWLIKLLLAELQTFLQESLDFLSSQGQAEPPSSDCSLPFALFMSAFQHPDRRIWACDRIVAELI